MPGFVPEDSPEVQEFVREVAQVLKKYEHVLAPRGGRGQRSSQEDTA